MSLIQTRNLLHESSPKTRLTNAEEAGTTVLRVENSTAMTAGWALQIGEVGGEQTEVVLGTAANVGTINVSTTDFEHPADTPVYFIKYNQVVFERSDTGTAGTATPMTNGTIEYQANDPYTVFDDTSGSSTYGYRTYYRNSALTTNSTESDWFTFAGPAFYSLAKIRERAKAKLWNAEWLTDDVVDDWINECKDIMVNKVIQTNEDYALGTAEVAIGTSGLGTITTADFSQVRRVWITYNGVDEFQSTKMSSNDFLPTQYFSSAHPYHYFMGDDIIAVKPAELGTAKLVFYRFGTTMVNDTDELPLPMRSYTDIFVDYVYAQALGKDEKFTEKNNQMVFVASNVQDFVSSLGARDKSGPTMIDIVEMVSGDDRIIN